MGDRGEHLTPKERLNRNILIGCNILGVLVGAAAVGFELYHRDGAAELISNQPLLLPTAIGLAVFWAIIMPIIAIYWHRNAVDEQEQAAYKDGAYYAAYTFIIGAPTWWILWRGGLLPEPDGIIIYALFIVIWTVTWAKKKYF